MYRRFFLALQLRDLCNEVPVHVVARKYDMPRGSVQTLAQTCHSFAAGMVKFCEHMGWGYEFVSVAVVVLLTVLSASWLPRSIICRTGFAPEPRPTFLNWLKSRLSRVGPRESMTLNSYGPATDNVAEGCSGRTDTATWPWLLMRTPRSWCPS